MEDNVDKQKITEEYLRLESQTQDELHDLAIKQRQKANSKQTDVLMDDSDELEPEEDKFNRYPIAQIITRRLISDNKIRTLLFVN